MTMKDAFDFAVPLQMSQRLSQKQDQQQRTGVSTPRYLCGVAAAVADFF